MGGEIIYFVKVSSGRCGKRGEVRQIKEQPRYVSENTADYGTELSSTQKIHAAHTGDGKNNNGQGPLEPAPFAKDHVASPSKDTVRQSAL
jgi:hypothetical protein